MSFLLGEQASWHSSSPSQHEDDLDSCEEELPPASQNIGARAWARGRSLEIPIDDGGVELLHARHPDSTFEKKHTSSSPGSAAADLRETPLLPQASAPKQKMILHQNIYQKEQDHEGSELFWKTAAIALGCLALYL